MLRAWMRTVIVLVVSLPALSASANERHFAFTYESGTLPAGSAEIEPQVTWRVGRDHYYSAFDQRFEFEYGLTDRLLTAFYVNFGATTQWTAMNPRETSFDYQGISTE